MLVWLSLCASWVEPASSFAGASRHSVCSCSLPLLLVFCQNLSLSLLCLQCVSGRVRVSVLLDAFHIVAVGRTCLGGAAQRGYFGMVPPAGMPRANSCRNIQKYISLLLPHRWDTSSASRWQSGTLLLIHQQSDDEIIPLVLMQLIL